MTPAQAIAMLDRQVAKHGQTVKLKRGAGALTDVRGFVRGFKPSELVGTLQQGDSSVVLSPSVLGVLGIPTKGNKVVIATSSATVQSVEQVRLDDVLVRVNLVVRGD